MGNRPVELQLENEWLRYRVRHLRAILRRVKEPVAATLLRELIVEAEDRLDFLERMRVQEMLE
jgi:hypothetical protein